MYFKEDMNSPGNPGLTRTQLLCTSKYFNVAVKGLFDGICFKGLGVGVRGSLLPNSRSPQEKPLIEKIWRGSIFGVLFGRLVGCLYTLTRDVKITRDH